MSQILTWSLAVGCALGAGLWLVFVRLPAMRVVTFADRVAPQLRSHVSRSRLLGSLGPREAPLGPLSTLFGPVLGDITAWVNRINPVSGNLQARLRKAGLKMTTTEFRASQLGWAGVGLLLSLVWAVFGTVSGQTHWLVATILVVASTVSGYLLREWYLGEQIQRRSRRILSQFPSVAELLALAVAAGESTTGAVERISRIVEGDLAEEFQLTLSDLRSGTPLTTALNRMSDRVELSAMTRFVDALTVAVERGTPIAEVVRAQAQDVRDAAKRELMETAGKKEIGMLAPVVFGVLPLTIVFAVYPGLSLIDLNL